MLPIATLETHEAIFAQFACEYIADVHSYHVLQARERLSTRAPAEKGCCAQTALSDEYANRRVAVIRPDYSVTRDDP
jgi:hypothetical protein